MPSGRPKVTIVIAHYAIRMSWFFTKALPIIERVWNRGCPSVYQIVYGGRHRDAQTYYPRVQVQVHD